MTVNLLEPALALHSPWTPLEAAFRSGLSVDRLRRYRKDRDKQAWGPAIGRYMFNVELASALHPALNWAEITLRNHLHALIASEYPLGDGRGYNRVASWLDAVPPVLLPPEQEKVRRAITDFNHRNSANGRQAGSHAQPKVLNEGRLVAELGLGFWTRLMDGVYADWRNPANPRFWPRLLDRAFPHCSGPERNRKSIHGRYMSIKELRNRTFHHERISHMATLERYDELLQAVHWVNPMLADTLRERERPRFSTVHENGPQPFVEWATDRIAAGEA